MLQIIRRGRRPFWDIDGYCSSLSTKHHDVVTSHWGNYDENPEVYGINDPFIFFFGWEVPTKNCTKPQKTNPPRNQQIWQGDQSDRGWRWRHRWCHEYHEWGAVATVQKILLSAIGLTWFNIVGSLISFTINRFNILWMVAKSCTTKRIAETLEIMGCLPSFSTGAGFRNHPPKFLKYVPDIPHILPYIPTYFPYMPHVWSLNSDRSQSSRGRSKLAGQFLGRKAHVLAPWTAQADI